MDGEVLKVQLEGSPDDDGTLLLGEFIDELEAILRALKQTTRIMTQGKEKALTFRVVDLSHNSPYSVKIQPHARQERYFHVQRGVARKLVTSIRIVQRRHRLPADFDYEAVDSIVALASPLKRVSNVILNVDGNKKTAVVTKSLVHTVEEIRGRDNTTPGSVMGMLEALNAHNLNQFTIYPVVGAKRITCKFDAEMKNQVFASAGQYVRVEGVLQYHKDHKHPYYIKVSNLRTLPQDSVLKFADLRGLAPDATSGLAAEDWTRKLRDDSW